MPVKFTLKKFILLLTSVVGLICWKITLALVATSLLIWLGGEILPFTKDDHTEPKDPYYD